MFAFTPNPTTNNVKINVSKNNKNIKEVQIIDKFENTKKLIKYSGDQKMINLSIFELPPDIYCIKIHDGLKWKINN